MTPRFGRKSLLFSLFGFVWEKSFHRTKRYQPSSLNCGARSSAAIAALEPGLRRSEEAALIARFPDLPGFASARTVHLFCSAFPGRDCNQRTIRNLLRNGEVCSLPSRGSLLPCFAHSTASPTQPPSCVRVSEAFPSHAPISWRFSQTSWTGSLCPDLHSTNEGSVWGEAPAITTAYYRCYDPILRAGPSA